MAEPARVLDYEEYTFGSAAPVREALPESAPDTHDTPIEHGRPRSMERARAAVAQQLIPNVSLFSIFGALFVSVLMIFVMLAQINYKEVSNETVNLNAQLGGLMEQQRMLEISFESVIDLKEVERFARDELGMSKPESDQITIIRSAPRDRAMVVQGGEESALRGFGSFISSLFEYFRR